MLNIDAALCCHIGCVRKNNEDNFYFCGEVLSDSNRSIGAMLKANCFDSGQIYALSDGMGGEEAGEIASGIAVNSIANAVKELETEDIADLLEATDRAIALAQTKILAEDRRMGATLAALLLSEKGYQSVHLGDSRVYSFRAGHLQQLTRDHSEAQRLVNLGLLQAKEAAEHPSNHVLTQHLGMSLGGERIRGERSPIYPWQGQERFLLCSDGLHGMLGAERIALRLQSAFTAAEAAKELLDEALLLGGRDNISLIVLFCKGSSPFESTESLERTLPLSF